MSLSIYSCTHQADDVFQGCHKWLGAEPARHDSYLTPENISTIRRVLAECTAGCHPWKATTFLPTRLIDVGTSLSDTPRLVSSSNIFITTETKYATLSYCWGNREDAEAQLKTERATIEKRCEGIPCEIMTPAIKDAVELTRAIGLRYIWIDALCIIQDDISDWSYESGQMNRVFHHAFVTFCGLSSTSCHEPFLRRVRTITVPFQSALRPELNGYLSVRLRPTTTDHHERRGYPLDRFISMWAYRAWIYQEEKLSTRLLLFGATKMHFRCGTHQWSEGDGNLSRLDSSVISLHHRTIDIKQGEYPASSLYRNWNILVKDYARREATHETDRLPAISGLARLIWETLGDHYVAGLWKGDIFNGLAWSSMPISYGLQNHLQSIRERVYLAPSWSWASYKGAGIYTDNLGWTTVSDCILLDIDVKPDLQNPFGRVYGGYLRLRGQMTPIPGSLSKIKPNGERSSKWQLNSGGQYGVVTARLDWFQQGEEEEGLENLVMLLLHYGKLTKQPASSHSSHTDSSDSLDETKHLEIEALMLYPTKIPDEYYRVGLVSSYGQAGYNLMRAWFENEGAEKVCTII